MPAPAYAPTAYFCAPLYPFPLMPTPTYLTQHQNRFLEELMDWLRIPSVSADPKFHPDVLRAADFLKTKILHSFIPKKSMLTPFYLRPPKMSQQ